MNLIQGDALEIVKTFEDNSVDHVFTSPPYNVGRKREGKSTQRAKYEFFEDNNGEYFVWCVEIINELLRITKGHIFWNIQPNWTNKKDVYLLMGYYSDKLLQNFIWTKEFFTPASSQYAISNAVEYILVISNLNRVKGNKKFNKNHIHTTKRPAGSEDHNAVMNTEVADFIIENFTKEDQVILDPFMGLGTTGISCKKFNRQFIGIELVQEYLNASFVRIKNG